MGVGGGRGAEARRREAAGQVGGYARLEEAGYLRGQAVYMDVFFHPPRLDGEEAGASAYPAEHLDGALPALRGLYRSADADANANAATAAPPQDFLPRPRPLPALDRRRVVGRRRRFAGESGLVRGEQSILKGISTKTKSAIQPIHPDTLIRNI